MLDVPSFADLNLDVVLPVVFLGFYTTVLLVVDLFIPKDQKLLTAQLAGVGVIVAFILNIVTFDSDQTALNGMFGADTFSGFLNLVILLTTFLVLLISYDYMQRASITQTEFYSLLLFSATGMMLMGSANDLVVVFIALELLSIPLYVMAAMRHNNAKSEESGMKYFILGAFASAFFVYGAALVYGATGTTDLASIFAAIDGIIGADGPEQFYLVIGAGLVMVGLGFKVAAVPFHMWTPDVYEGAPTPVTAFMSVGAKTGGFAALLRILVIALPNLVVEPGDAAASWQTVVAIIAAVSMILGNFVAISQSNIKRMLGYSSIAHAGYLLMAVAAAGSAGIGVQAVEAALIYLLAYAFTNIGAFAVVLAVENDDGSGVEINDFVGLGRSRPLLAGIMAFFMLSLTGVPTTAGFIGKFFVFDAALDAELTWLAIIGVLTSVVGAFYYVRVIVNMYLQEGDGEQAAGATQYVSWAVYASFAGVLLIGLFPALATNLLDNMTIVAAIF